MYDYVRSTQGTREKKAATKIRDTAFFRMGKIFAVFICPSPETHHNVSATHCCLLLHYYVFNIKNRNHTTQLQFLSPSYLVWMSSQRVILRQYTWWYFPFSDEPRICVPIDHNDHHHVEINEEYRIERWMLMVIKGSRMTMPRLTLPTLSHRMPRWDIKALSCFSH